MGSVTARNGVRVRAWVTSVSFSRRSGAWSMFVNVVKDPELNVPKRFHIKSSLSVQIKPRENVRESLDSRFGLHLKNKVGTRWLNKSFIICVVVFPLFAEHPFLRYSDRVGSRWGNGVYQIRHDATALPRPKTTATSSRFTFSY